MIRERTAPWVARKVSMVLIAGACLLAACGGSGSSGFDGEPSSEPETIEAAVEQGTCLTFEGLTYCGSGAEFTLDSGSAAVAIDEPLTPVACTEIPGEMTCATSVDFVPDGFPVGTAYVVASADSFQGPWGVSAQRPPPSSGDAPEDREAQVEVPTPTGETSPLVVAVLIYLDALPQDLPTEAPLLSDLGADVVYVSRALEVTTDQ